MEQKKKKLPERQCLGCGERHLKAELLRVVRDPEGNVTLDFTGKKSGRGAYICKNVACLRQARRKRRSLKYFVGLAKGKRRATQQPSGCEERGCAA